MPNDHYVSKWQIKRWLGQGHTKVRVYDTRSGRFSWESPRSLFSARSLNSTAAERRIGELMETPLTEEASSPLYARPSQSGELQAGNWRVFRAAWLFILLQGARTASSISGDSSTLDKLIVRPERDLDALCHLLDQQNNLVWFRHPEPRLFLPSICHFAVPIHDSGCATGFSMAQAIPLDPSTAILMTSKDARLTAGKTQVIDHLKSIPLLGVGSGEHVRQLVVPPAVCAAYPTAEKEAELRNVIDELRQGANDMLRWIQELRRIQYNSLAGIGFQLVRAPGNERYVIKK